MGCEAGAGNVMPEVERLPMSPFVLVSYRNHSIAKLLN